MTDQDTQEFSYASIAEEYELNEDAFMHFCNNHHIPIYEAESAIAGFEDSYQGQFDSPKEFILYIAEQFEEQWFFEIPEDVLSCIDFDKLWECSYKHCYWHQDEFFFRDV